MVENPGKTLYTDAFRPVNLPETVRVEEDGTGLPKTVELPRRQAIIAIEDRWRVDDEWWRQESVSRLYHSVRLASGQRLVLYKDLLTGYWYRQSY